MMISLKIIHGSVLIPLYFYANKRDTIASKEKKKHRNNQKAKEKTTEKKYKLNKQKHQSNGDIKYVHIKYSTVCDRAW